MRAARVLALLLVGCAKPPAALAPGLPPAPCAGREAVAFWDDRLSRMVRTESWKKSMDHYGWYEAHADSATFKRELEAEREVTGKLLRDLGYAK